ANGVVLAPSTASVGRYCVYFGSPTGASRLNESTPPGMKIDTSTRSPGAVAARATPSSKAPSPSFDAPYTDIASPAERSTNERRDRPVSAGVSMPGSIASNPWPARAAGAGQVGEADEAVEQS